MSATIQVPPEYGYVVLTATLSTFVSQWHVYHTAKYRRIAKVPYPECYASAQEAKENKDKYLFNCAQRSHAHFMEHHSTFLTSLLIAGLKYPLLSAGLGLVWCGARVVYALGYVSETKTEGKGRLPGNVYAIPEVLLQLFAGWTGYRLLTD